MGKEDEMMNVRQETDREPESPAQEEMLSDKTVNNGDDLHAYAGFWIRFWAYTADLLIIFALGQIVIGIVEILIDLPPANHIFSLENIISAVIFYLYFVLMTKFFGQTIGKMIFGLKVIPLKEQELSWGTILFREWIGRYISATIIILYIVVAFMPKKQGIHDYFADTAVIHEGYVKKRALHSA